MKVKKKVTGQWATILINSGNTHNFVDIAMARRSSLPIEIGANVKVLMANGDQLSSEGLGQNIKFCVLGYSFETNLFVIDLAGCHVVLGVR